MTSVGDAGTKRKDNDHKSENNREILAAYMTRKGMIPRELALDDLS